MRVKKKRKKERKEKERKEKEKRAVYEKVTSYLKKLNGGVKKKKKKHHGEEIICISSPFPPLLFHPDCFFKG
jgi:hypothetical protein